MNDCGFIDDGYTRPGYVAAVEGLHPACRFEFRPMLSRDRAILNKEIIRRDDPAWAETAASEAVAKHVTAWDLRDRSGKMVEVSAATVKRVHPALFGKLYQIVLGLLPSDADPEAPEPAEKIDLTEADEEKNFSAG